jgi:hypothetical protein
MFRSPDPLPSHWEVLSAEDQHDYIALRTQFQDMVGKTRRGESAGVFGDRLRLIRAFIERNESSKWKRSLVCGIAFMDSAIGINIRQLRILLCRCKSSINGSFQQIGYTAKPAGQALDEELRNLIPPLRSDHIELKKWTIRCGQLPAELGKANPSKVADFVRCGFPCPAKCRHKVYDILQTWVPLPTETVPL